MDREQIEKEAYKRHPIEYNHFQMLQASDCLWNGFVEGAEWMQEQYESNRLKHCDNITREEFDRESEFIEWFFSQGFDRQPTFSDAIEWERTQMSDESQKQVRLDTIQCCEEYYKRFGTLDGVYEHYFADVTEK